MHHPKRQHQRPQADTAFKAEQEKRRREEVLAQAPGLCVLKAIGNAIPVRLLKRDLLFLAERLIAMLDERFSGQKQASYLFCWRPRCDLNPCATGLSSYTLAMVRTSRQFVMAKCGHLDGLHSDRGITMSTRSGDLDPGVILYLLQQKNCSSSQVNELVTKKAGLLGLSGISSDMKDLLTKEKGNALAAEAIAVFCYQPRSTSAP